MLRIADCVVDFQLPRPTERQRVGNQIDAAMIFAGAGLRNPLESINEIFGCLKAEDIYGWVVLGVGEQAEGQL